MPDNDPLVFTDMAEYEASERSRRQSRLDALKQAKAKGPLSAKQEDELRRLHRELGRFRDAPRLEELNLSTRPLSDAEKDELKKLKLAFTQFNGDPHVLDPLFKEVQRAMALTHQAVGDHLRGRLPSQNKSEPEPLDRLPEDEKELAAIYGIMVRERQTQPDPDKPDRYRTFVRALAAARGEYNASKELFDAVLPILGAEGDKTGENRVRAEHWATVVRILGTQGVTADSTHLRLKAVNALDSLIGGGGSVPSSIPIILPDLEEFSNLDIISDNLHAMQAIYFTASLEEVRIFEVVEKLVELFQLGMLPVGKGTAGDYLYNYWKRSADRISEVERRNIYARSFGYPGGDPSQGNPNRDFNDLWLRFISSVSSYVRQLKVDDLLRSNVPVSVSQEQVRKSGRDLAANLSLHGYGIAYFVATELQSSIREFIALLSDPEIKSAYGARDMWQVIEQVSTLELGGARNSVRYRTMATSGAVIIRWLADNANQLAGSAFTDIIDLGEIRNPPPRDAGTSPTTEPTDADLLNACEQWLAVTGTPDLRVEEYAQPSEGPTATSSPVRIPTIAKDLLDSVGIQAGVASGTYPTNGLGTNGGQRRS
jgi:hypothetical protein